MSDRSITRSQVCAAAQALPDVLQVDGQELRIFASDQALLGWLAAKADVEAWALPARPEDLRARWSTRRIAERLKYSQRTIFRSLAKLKAAGLVALDAHHHLESRYLLRPDRIVEASARWVDELRRRAVDFAARVTPELNAFRQPEAGLRGAHARAMQQPAAPTAEELAALEVLAGPPRPAADAPRGEYVPWALGQADALIRRHGVPDWPCLRRCARGAELLRVILAWGALKHPSRPPSYWWGHAQGYGDRIRVLWSAQGEQDGEALVRSLALVIEAFNAGALRRWDSRRDRWTGGPAVLEEWLRMRPGAWEFACELAEQHEARRLARLARADAPDEGLDQPLDQPPTPALVAVEPPSAWEQLFGSKRPSAPAPEPPPVEYSEWEQIFQALKQWVTRTLRRPTWGAARRAGYRDAVHAADWERVRSELRQLQAEVIQRAREAGLSPPPAASCTV